MAGSKLYNPDLRRLRALTFLQRRMANISLANIATEFGVESKTVSKEIDWAKRQGLIETYADQILHSLVPEAIKTVEAALKKGDLKAALAVLKGTGLLSESKPMAQQAPPQSGEPETLEAYIRITKPAGGGSERTQFKPGIRNNLIPPTKQTAADQANEAGAVEGNPLNEAPILDAEVITEALQRDGHEGGVSDPQ